MTEYLRTFLGGDVVKDENRDVEEFLQNADENICLGQ